MGEYSGSLNYIENTGTATAPVFVQRTGSANPFDGMRIFWSPAPTFVDTDGDGDLDLVVGYGMGSFLYLENTGTSTAPVFVQRTGSANPFDGIAVGMYSTPALGDFDNDGTRRPCPSIDKLRPHVFCPSQATWTSSWAVQLARYSTLRTLGRLRRRFSW